MKADLQRAKDYHLKIEACIESLAPPQQDMINSIADQIRDVINRSPSKGMAYLAIALVGSECSYEIQSSHEQE